MTKIILSNLPSVSILSFVTSGLGQYSGSMQVHIYCGQTPGASISLARFAKPQSSATGSEQFVNTLNLQIFCDGQHSSFGLSTFNKNLKICNY